MAVSPVGSQIYVNQAAPLVSQLYQSVALRFDLQSYMAAEAVKDKEPKIEDPSKADGSGKIKEDDGSSHNEGQYKQSKKEKKESEEDDEDFYSAEIEHIIDLKV